ncbi:MAG: DUF481 domain-containing protein [Myxococcota bacterium]
MWLCVLTAALAQTPDFAEGALPANVEDLEVEVDQPKTKLTAELGFSYASGNAVFVSLNGALNLSHRWRRNRLMVPITLNVGQSIPDLDGSGTLDDQERAAGLQENARRVITEPRYDRFISERSSLFVVLGNMHDPFLGYRARPHQTIGYSRLFIDDDTTELRVEIGFDFAQEFYVEGTEPDFMPIYAGRFMGVLEHAFNDNVHLSDHVELFENVLDLRDFRLLNTATLSASLSSNLTLKLSHKLLFDNVPVETFRKTDQTTMVTLAVTLI